MSQLKPKKSNTSIHRLLLRRLALAAFLIAAVLSAPEDRGQV